MKFFGANLSANRTATIRRTRSNWVSVELFAHEGNIAEAAIAARCLIERKSNGIFARSADTFQQSLLYIYKKKGKKMREREKRSQPFATDKSEFNYCALTNRLVIYRESFVTLIFNQNFSHLFEDFFFLFLLFHLK